MDNRSTEDKKMTEYQWDEEFYRQIVIDHNYRFPKFNNIDYPILRDKNINKSCDSSKTVH